MIPSLPGPRPVLRNPDQDAIVRILAGHGSSCPAASLFARVERAVPGIRSDFAALAAEALRLERHGLVEHGLADGWRVTLSLTDRGRRFVRVRYRDRHLGPLVGVTVMAPLMASCAWNKVAPPPVAVETAPARVERVVARLEQFVIDGQLVYAYCAPPHCPVPSVKDRVPGAGLPDLLPARPDTEPVPLPTAGSPSAEVATRAASTTTLAPLPLDIGSQIARAARAQASSAGSEPSLPRAAAAPGPQPPPMRPIVLKTETASPQPISRALHTVFFDYASADLHGAELAFAKRIATAAKVGARVTIVGMTDRTGDAAKNERLAQRRADAMLLLLAQAGVDPDQVTIQVDTTGTRTVPPQTIGRALRADGDARFRRVDVLITYGAEADSRPDRSASTTLFGVPTPYEIVSMRGIAGM